MKKIITVFLTCLLFTSLTVSSFAVNIQVAENDVVDAAVSVGSELMTFAKSVILMEKSTGKVLYAVNENEKLFPASVTKIMTILLVCEAIEDGKINLTDIVTCSENAASKGGSQIWLEAGEKMSVEDLLKSTCVYSANDACTLLGEYIAGSELAFNELMNKRKDELGMTNTHFDNCTGLDDTTDTHLTTAYDVALMSRELLKYEFIKQYTTIWMDSVREGKTELVNTNKLVRYYDGITGLKTGTTTKAGCCVAASAERNGMELIAVVMGSENSKDRFTSAENMLDWGFANYEIYTPNVEFNANATVKVKFGMLDNVKIKLPKISPVLINKGNAGKINIDLSLPENITAPVEKDSQLGTVKVMLGEKVIAEYEITAAEKVEKITFFGAMLKLLSSFCK